MGATVRIRVVSQMSHHFLACEWVCRIIRSGVHTGMLVEHINIIYVNMYVYKELGFCSLVSVVWFFFTAILTLIMLKALIVFTLKKIIFKKILNFLV